MSASVLVAATVKTKRPGRRGYTYRYHPQNMRGLPLLSAMRWIDLEWDRAASAGETIVQCYLTPVA